MKLIVRITMLFAFVLALASSALAQDATKDKFTAGTGVDGGTYALVHKQWQGVCPAHNLPVYMFEDPATKKVRTTNGTVENIQAILGNKIDMAYVQADALWSFLQRDPNVQALRVLAVLYPEAVHVITTSASVIIKVPGKVYGTNDVQKTLASTADLQGLSVAAWGGSKVTADIINQHMLGNSMNVVEVSNRNDAFQKLTTGQVQAVIAVGGYPMEWIEQLGSEYKLLPFPKAMRDKVGTSYPEAKLTYTKMGASGVESGETTSMLVSQNFGAKRGRALTEAFDCMVSHLEDLRDTTGMHPVWKKVDPDRKSSFLPTFPFVRDTPAAPAAKTPAKKK